MRFLVAKADVKATDKLKTNALLAACIGNDTATIQMMIDAGLDVNVASPAPPPALAAGTRNNSSMLLLAKGARGNPVTPEPDGRVKRAIAIGLFPFDSSAPLGRAGVLKILLDAEPR